MGRATARHSSRRTDNGSNTPVSGSFPRPSGENADGAPTLRNLVPWKEMEKKLAVRLAARAAAGELSGDLEELRVPPTEARSEPPPSSGVRPSLFEQGNSDDLTYTVYSLSDLNQRPKERPAPAPAPEPLPARIVRLGPMTLRVPGELLTKPVLVAVGLAFGAFALLVFVVLAVAELTDDMKTRTLNVANEAPKLALVPPPPAAAPAPAAAPQPLALSTPSTNVDDDITLELDDAPAPRATPSKKAGGRKKGR
jgi:hypothetical protein